MFLCLKHDGSSLMIIRTECTVRVDTGKYREEFKNFPTSEFASTSLFTLQ